MNIDEVLQVLVKNVDSTASRITKRLVIDVAVADENVVVVAADQAHDAMPYRLFLAEAYASEELEM